MTILELFAGAGGASLGLHRAGFAHVACVELNASAAATLRAAGFPAIEADGRAVDFEDAATVRAVTQIGNDKLGYSGDWPGRSWRHAPDAWVERTWPQVADGVANALAKVSYYNQQSQNIPVVSPAGLRVVNAGAASGTAGVDGLPPTEAGWQAFLAQAPDAGLKFGELAEAGRWWWGRSIPRNLLSGEAEAADDVGEGAA